MGLGHELSFQRLGSREQDPPVRNPDTHLFRGSQDQGSSGGVVADAVGNGCGCGEVVLRSLGLHRVGIGHRICLWCLGYREQGPLAKNADIIFAGTVRVKAP